MRPSTVSHAPKAVNDLPGDERESFEVTVSSRHRYFGGKLRR
jgi:hypothetical protein